jgi:hypothetical protein
MHISLRRYLLAALIFCSYRLEAQTYQSIFGQDSTKWNVYHEIIDGGFTLPIKVVKDSLFNGFHYKLIHDDFTGEEAFLREDSTHARLYYLLPDSQQEHLIMNLDWGIGDTAFSFNPNIGDFTIIDTVFIENNVKHLITNIDLISWPLLNKLEFVEGVGPTGGINLPYLILFSTLVCAYKDEVQTFSLPDTTFGCDYSWVGINDIHNNHAFSIVPNPSSDIIQINEIGSTQHDVTFEIYDLMGQMRLNGKLSSTQKSISIQHLNPGTYFLKLYNEKSILDSGLLVKK